MPPKGSPQAGKRQRQAKNNNKDDAEKPKKTRNQQNKDDAEQKPKPDKKQLIQSMFCSKPWSPSEFTPVSENNVVDELTSGEANACNVIETHDDSTTGDGVAKHVGPTTGDGVAKHVEPTTGDGVAMDVATGIEGHNQLSPSGGNQVQGAIQDIQVVEAGVDVDGIGDGRLTPKVASEVNVDVSGEGHNDPTLGSQVEAVSAAEDVLLESANEGAAEALSKIEDQDAPSQTGQSQSEDQDAPSQTGQSKSEDQDAPSQSLTQNLEKFMAPTPGDEGMDDDASSSATLELGSLHIPESIGFGLGLSSHSGASSRGTVIPPGVADTADTQLQLVEVQEPLTSLEPSGHLPSSSPTLEVEIPRVVPAVHGPSCQEEYKPQCRYIACDGAMNDDIDDLGELPDIASFIPNTGKERLEPSSSPMPSSSPTPSPAPGSPGPVQTLLGTPIKTPSSQSAGTPLLSASSAATPSTGTSASPGKQGPPQVRCGISPCKLGGLNLDHFMQGFWQLETDSPTAQAVTYFGNLLFEIVVFLLFVIVCFFV